MRLRQRDLKEVYLEPRIKIEQENVESDEEESYSYSSSVLLMCNIKYIKNSYQSDATGEKNIGSIELLYQGEVSIKKQDRMFININEQEKVFYIVDDIIPYSNHVKVILKEV